MKIFVQHLISLIVFTTAHATEIFISPDHGFMALGFPSPPEKYEFDNALGKSTVFQSAQGDESIPEVFLYQIFIHKIEVMKNNDPSNKDFQLKLLQTRLDAVMKEIKAISYKAERSELCGWPALEFFSTHDGILADGVRSYKRGITFIHEGSYYTLQVHGLSDNDKLKQLSTTFWSTFSFPDPKTLKALLEWQKMENKSEMATPRKPSD